MPLKAAALLDNLGARCLQGGLIRPRMLATGLGLIEVEQRRPASLTPVLKASLARGFFVSGVFYSTIFSVAIASKPRHTRPIVRTMLVCFSVGITRIAATQCVIILVMKFFTAAAAQLIA